MKESDRMRDDILTDNTKIEKCKQCKDCMLWRKSEVFENEYDKSSCKAYPYPDHKPLDVITNHGICPYRKVRS